MPHQTISRPDGQHLAYEEHGGSGDLILLLPGIGDLRSEYRFLTPALLKAGYRVVSADLRGHGDSSGGFRDYSVVAVADDLLALIDHLGGPATVIGTSFAPAAAAWAAAEAPAKIRSLVLISPHMEAATGFAATAMKLALGALLSGPWKARAWEGQYASWYPSRKPDDFDSYRREVRAMAADPERARAIRQLLTASRDGLAERLERVGAPALVIMGAKDSHFGDPAGEGRKVAERLGGELELVAGAGHYPQAEMPAETTPAILDFLSKVAAASVGAAG